MTNIVVCASGDGSNFEAIVEACRRGHLPAQVTGLIVNRSKAGAVDRAARLGIPCKILCPKDYPSRELWDAEMVRQLQDWRADWVVLAGFLALIGAKVLASYPRRVVNSHPSLLPKYGGAGMYGDRVHQAVLAAKEKQTGITVHLVDEVYDQGKILAQEPVSIERDDTPERLAARVKALENSFYPRVLNDLVTGRITTS